MGRHQNPEAKIIGDKLVISVNIASLQSAIKHSPALEYYDDKTGNIRYPRITDKLVFAKEVASVLNSDGEDGTTMIHEMFDRAFEQIGENGAEGIKFPDDNE